MNYLLRAPRRSAELSLKSTSLERSYHSLLKESVPILLIAIVSLIGTGRSALAQSTESNLPYTLSDKQASVVSPDIKNLLQYYDKQIYFTQNQGQWPDQILYKADFPLGQAIATDQGMIMGTFDPSSIHARNEQIIQQEKAKQKGLLAIKPDAVIKGHGWLMNFVNRSPSMSIEVTDKHPDVFNYFKGGTSGNTKGVNNYQEVWYKNVYDKVDVRYYPSKEGALEYDMVCKPGFDKKQILIKLEGIDQIKIKGNGHLILKTTVGDMDFPAPVAYQIINGKQQPVQANYIITGKNEFTFELGTYDVSKPLIIDPIALRWATWITNNSADADHGHCIWVDPADGAIYVVARIIGTGLITVNAFQNAYAGGSGDDIVIGKYMEPASIGGSGTRVWQTYFGGTGEDNPYAMEQGPDGNLYITGYTQSTNIPLIGGSAFNGGGASIDTRLQTTDNIFVLKVNTAGNSFKMAVIGGNGDDDPYDLRITSSGDVIVCGFTRSSNLGTLFPSSGASNINNGGNDAIVFKINSDLSAISWIKNYGGSGDDQANIMLTNPATGDIFVGGQTKSANFPTTGARQFALSGVEDGFIQKLSSGGTTKWSSYFQSASTKSTDILCMEFNTTKDKLFFGGITSGLNLSNISTSGVFNSTYGSGVNDFFVARMDTNQSFNMSTYIGGSGNEVNMMGLNVDLNNDVYIFGYCNSTNFPTTPGALQTQLNNTSTNIATPPNDKVFLKLSSSLSNLIYSTYYGGSSDDYDPVGERGIKFSNCRIYTIVTGTSNDIPLTQGAVTTNKISGNNVVYEPGLVVWANPPDLSGNSIFGSQTICSGFKPTGFTGSLPAYVLPTISRNGNFTTYPTINAVITYQWQKSTDSINWTNVSPGGHYQNLSSDSIGPMFLKTYFRRIIGGDACIIAGAADQTVIVKVLSIPGTVTNVGCYGSNTGSIAVAPNGTSPYSYLWSTGATTQTISNLFSGTYTVTVTDASTCSTAAQFTVTQPAALSAITSSTPAGCGTSNGTATVTANNGTSPYSYVWSPNGATTVSINGLPSGSYSVVVKDAKNCLYNANATVGSASQFSATQVNASCHGSSNGSIDVAVSGAQGIVSYLWNNGVTTQDRTGLVAGTYTVTATDAGFCSVTISKTITQPDVLVLNGITNNITITAGHDGSINVTTTGGTPLYSYLWNDGVTTEDRTNLSAGTYTVTATDSKGCVIQKSFTLTQPPCNLNISATALNATCYAASNGSIDVTVTGAQGITTYLWNNGATTQDRTGLAAGTYTVTATDAGNCSATITKTITQPAVLAISGIIADVTITSGNNGSIDVSVTGGTPAYQYLWNNGAITQDRVGLTAGTYTVTLTDTKGCTSQQTFTVNQPPCTLNLVATLVNVTCNGNADGSINVITSGVQGNVNYIWNNGATTEDRSGLAPGTYTVTATDAGNCSATITKTITQPAVLATSGIISDVTITSGNNGSIDVTVTGGTPGYQYLWNNGAITQDRAGLSAGTYTVTVTDSHGCSAQQTFTVNQPPCSLSLAATTINVTCNGNADGIINVVPSGAQGNVSYIWNNGATTEDRSGLAPGTYTVTATDAGNCSATITKIITQPAVLAISGIISDVTITSGNNGSIDVTVTGGTPGYQYLWNNGAITQDRAGLSAGTYTVTVTDDHGCSAQQTFTVNQPPCSLTLAATTINITCNGNADGIINMVTSGAQGNVSYIWNNGATTEDRSGLAPGTYTVTAIDAGNCSATINKTITQPAVLAISGIISDVTITSGNNGSIDVSVTGGTSGYQYLWNNGAITQDRVGLSAGTYTVTVTDNHGCSAQLTFMVNQPSCSLTLAATTINITCNGNADGTINVVTSGAQGNVSYIWNNGVTTEDLSGLTPGTYTVTATDAGTCSATITKIITQPAVLAISGIISDVTITSGNNGSIDVTVTGGTPGYQYLWNNGVITQDRAGLSAGIYQVTVTDAHGCTTQQSFTVNQPSCTLSLAATTVNVTCHGNADGTINVVTSGAQGNVSYVWNNGATTEDLSGLAPGTYTVTATDAGNCSATITKTITQPAVLAISGIISDVTITSGNNGSIDVTVTGGTPGYQYLWNNGAITQDRAGLSAGTYTVTVTDSHGCSAQQTFTVNQPSCSLSLAATTINVTCHSNADGIINVVTSGAQGNVSYIWNNGATTEDLNGLTPGTYTVTATDAGNCSATITKIIAQPAVLAISGVIADVTITSGGNGSIDVTVTGGTPGYQYLWNNGAITQDRSGLSAGIYTVTVTDNHGCSAQQTFTVNQPSCSLSLAATTINVTCHSNADGIINVVTSGAQGNVSYIWNNGATTEDLSGLTPGTYTVTATDAGTCSATITKTITQPAVLAISGVIADVTITSGGNGSIDVTVIGGTPGYQYLWNNGAITEDHEGLAAGTYMINVIDNHGCSVQDTFMVNEPSCTLSLSAVTVKVTCNGNADGIINVVTSGAQGNVNYIWNNGATTENLTGLEPGTYTVTATDAGNCSATITKIITQPAVLTISGVIADVTITSGNDGSIDVSVTGGTPVYHYLWNNGAITQDLAGLSAGIYTVTVTDKRGCIAQQTFTVNQPPCTLSLAVTLVNVTCHGNADGAIDVITSGTQGSVNYIWNNGATTEDLTGLVAGTYTVTATDAGNCSSSLIATITEPEVLSINGVTSDVTITTGNDGSIDASVSGGTPEYQYLWNDGAITEDREGLAAGTYTIIVTDNHGCSDHQTFTVNQPSCTLSLTATTVNVTCHSNTDGAIELITSGAQGNVSYIWNDEATTQDRTGLPAGIYTVTATDGGNCISTFTETITEPEILIISGQIHDVTITSWNDGSIDVTVTGGSPEYQYLWNDDITTQNREGLLAGTYTVTVLDNHGCSAQQTFIVGQPQCSLSLASIFVNLTCNGSADGAIDVTTLGAQGNVNYVWNNEASSEDLSGLVAGIYNVTATDAGTCSSTLTITITEPEVLSISGVISDVTITSGNDGSIDLTTTGGTAGYQYLWNDDVTTPNREGLPAGTYTVNVTDNHGCSAQQTFTVSQPACSLSLTTVGVNATCSGSVDGAIDLTVSGAQGNVSYMWNNGVSSEDLTGLSAGTYTILATDAGNCISMLTLTLTEPEVLGISAIVTDVTYTAGSDGSIDVTVTGGTPGYQYLWNDGANSEDRDGLAPGTYTITVTDSHGCSAQRTFIVSQPQCSLSITAVSFGVTCNGNADGAVDLIVTGSQGNVTYIWNNGATTEDLTGLPGDPYTVTVTDEGNCSATLLIKVAEPLVLELSGVIHDVTIDGTNDGSIDVTPYGGVPYYHYLWNDGTITQDRGGLFAGTYTVTLTDEHGCSVQQIFIVNQPACSLSLTAITLKVTCNGSADGMIYVIKSGAQGNVNYLWNNGAYTQDLTGLAPGTYTVTATDAGGCIATLTKTITEPDVLEISGIVNDVTFIEGDDGSIDLIVTGGNPEYQYLWNDGTTTQDRAGLPAGTYSVNVTDEKGCTAEHSFTVGFTLSNVTLPATTNHISMSLYPNPTADQFVIAVEADENASKTMSVEIVNPVGQVIYTSQPQAFHRSLKKQIDLEGMPNGVYTTRVTIDGKGFFNQLVIQH